MNSIISSLLFCMMLTGAADCPGLEETGSVGVETQGDLLSPPATQFPQSMIAEYFCIPGKRRKKVYCVLQQSDMITDKFGQRILQIERDTLLMGKINNRFTCPVSPQELTDLGLQPFE